jgi:hypothetical protein
VAFLCSYLQPTATRRATRADGHRRGNDVNPHRAEGDFCLRGESRGVSLLDDVAEAAYGYRKAEQERQKAREKLRAAVNAAADEGVPLARIARAAGLSRERIRQLRAGR